MWHRMLFPAQEPNGRMDAIYLDRWVTHAVKEFSQNNANKPLAEQVAGIVPLLNVAMREVVRQTLCFCEERGELLDKVWNSYVGLFDFVLKEMRLSLETSKKKAAELEKTLLQE